MTNTLPEAFEALEVHVARWAKDTTAERVAARATASMAEIEQFYAVALPHAREALSYCARFPLDDMPRDAQTLAKLLLGLAQAAVAVEIHRAPRAPGSAWPNSVVVERGAEPFG